MALFSHIEKAGKASLRPTQLLERCSAFPRLGGICFTSYADRLYTNRVRQLDSPFTGKRCLIQIRTRC